ncbi:hypothetical protein FIA58_000495 [Flavobacterium jejuense]|uniref:YtkA-like domain-containing protein n=1 Tax=Flavobacterium jejuense TaxID=1544455 RepID=A0ABX0IKN0_9FLAO|nr:hypothetical protein [Flavobacterium jejuense]NHN24141.1 hypothetical protein [Flavobacterium jejuense]
MKILKYTFLFLLGTMISCSSDDDNTTTPIASELDGINKIQEITNDTHVIELYSANGALEQGYNAISLRIKNKTTNEYEKNATISWMPVMHMAMMNHSCPKSEIVKTASKETLYNGYIIFQMAQNATEYWDLKVDYTIADSDYTATAVVNVPASAKQSVTSFMGSDNKRYIIAMIEPNNPKVALNDVTCGLYKMENMMSFPVVDDFKIKIDPRMPSMGNHGSPNNVDLTQSTDKLYRGKLSLTMTGYWKINLQLVNDLSEVLKGETINETNTSSSIYLELEF